MTGGSTEPPLLVSVLVPMRNEERYIEGCLRSLAAQDPQTASKSWSSTANRRPLPRPRAAVHFRRRLMSRMPTIPPKNGARAKHRARRRARRSHRPRRRCADGARLPEPEYQPRCGETDADAVGGLSRASRKG
jgi:hypothetical protein